MPRVDVVVVSYNSRDRLRACVEPLAGAPGISVRVVDNDSPDDGLAAVAGLPVRAVQSGRNGGFAFGCNIGWRGGSAPLVLFLNPDARMTPHDLGVLCDRMDEDPSIGVLGPRILDEDGGLDLSIRAFPRLRTTYAQALFAHRLLPRAGWTDEIVRDPGRYAVRGPADWLSGACLLVRRTALERIGGLDEGFFLYCEDTDLCRRVRDAGWSVVFDPAASARHAGGASAPRASLFAVLAESRIRYARTHMTPAGALAERAGVALGELTHTVIARGRGARAGHARALWRAITAPWR